MWKIAAKVGVVVVVAAVVTLAIFILQAAMVQGKAEIALSDRLEVDLVDVDADCDVATQWERSLRDDSLRSCQSDSDCVLIGGIDGCGDALAKSHLEEFRELFLGWDKLVTNRGCARGRICRPSPWQEAQCIERVCTNVTVGPPPTEEELMEASRRVLAQPNDEAHP